MTKERNIIFKIALSAMFLALGLLLPFITGQIPEIGSMLCPMHIPVLLCGFICGWQYGFVIGFTAPLLRNLLFGMPPIYPTGLAMAFELATYGTLAALIYQLFDKIFKSNLLTIYSSLIISMLGGRLIWGTACYLMSLIDNSFNFTIDIFLTGGFITAWPGIVIQLILIPIIILTIQKTGLLNKSK